MAQYEPVSRSAHAGRFWRPFADLHFAAADSAAPLVASELPRAALCLPVAFLRDEGRLLPVALQGLEAGENLCLTADGKWRFPYVPACYRGHPFALRNTPQGPHVLCVDAESGLLSDSEGEPFFSDDGEPAQKLADVLRFLKAVVSDRERTLGLCEALEDAGLLEAWPISYSHAGKPRHVEGLQRVNEAALARCEPEALAALQASGALKVAYCQLLSQPNLAALVRMKQARAAAAFDLDNDDIEDLLGIKDEVLEFNF